MSGLEELEDGIVNCERCPRLREYCRIVARKKKREFLGWDYWGRPLPGFGDPKAKLLIVGLAPAAHGGLRTGRMFCGDHSGAWLTRALYQTGFANQKDSSSLDDGLQLSGAYITAVVRCAPPENKPAKVEIANCLPYLCQELRYLTDLKVVVVLGRIAFDGFLRAYGEIHDPSAIPIATFRQGTLCTLDSGKPVLIVSYHPSRQNTQTGKLKWDEWLGVFETARRLVDEIG